MIHGTRTAAGDASGPDGHERGTGIVDYRLARQAAVARYRTGQMSKGEVCDAHPELRRAAQYASRPSDEICPICAEHRLVLVTYAFGPKLPAHGRCVPDDRELRRLADTCPGATCYTVEVCCGCWWNHLRQTNLI